MTASSDVPNVPDVPDVSNVPEVSGGSGVPNVPEVSGGSDLPEGTNGTNWLSVPDVIGRPNQEDLVERMKQETIARLTAPLDEASLDGDYHLGLAQIAVLHFMTYAEQPVSHHPTTKFADARQIARMDYTLKQEVRELDKAIEQADLVQVADGLADIIYVCLSIATTYGIFMPPIMREVCNNNFLKTMYPKRFSELGKLLKPEGFKGPRISEILAYQEKIHGEVQEGSGT